MPFNSDKNGFQNEIEFIKSINNKKIININYNLQLFLEDIFPKITKTDIVKCYKNEKPQKCDIFIKVNDEVKRISIKKGVKNSVHNEPISEMIHFLIESHMPRDLVIEFLKYHYADGTTNGTGSVRMTIEDYKKEHQAKIDSINNFINQKSLLIKAIDRFVLKGRNSKEKIDAIIYGIPDDFLWIKRKDIYKILIKKRNNYSSGIHFSSLSYQPLNRCINNNPKYEKCRYISQVKWYNICDDIIENMNDNFNI